MLLRSLHSLNRDGRIELRSPSAPSARLAEDVWVFEGSVTLGSNRRPPEPHYTYLIRQITGDPWFHSGFGENFLESASSFPGIQGGYVLENVSNGALLSRTNGIGG